MKIETFQLERWMTTWELNVSHDITESGVSPLSITELLTLSDMTDEQGYIDRLLASQQLYSEARGTEELRTSVANTYASVGPDDVLVTTGAIEANYLVFNVLLNPGDHVVVTTPCYQQLVSIP
ncbi:MAG: aminotransferase class I/II-fold pyridoxal phosphate-dependent enzyme, partial [Chloroflexota bacterium]|nr:aminotransferase class I/II-fold pyridoxal phosphate-dependent enzyme [Chloroflexota bacterium]